MPVAALELRFDPAVVALSYLTAAFASFVALDLAQRVRNPGALSARIWWIAGSLSMGSGIWAMHFVGMLALRLPFAVGYDTVTTLVSWLAAVGVSAIALRVASQEQLTVKRLTLGALSMGAGICGMHYTGMAALMLSPGIRWNWTLVAASAAVATGAAAAALVIFFWLRRLTTARQARWGQVVAALVMGAAVAGMHYTGMAAAGFAEGTVCLSANGLRGDNLGTLVAGATFALLLLTLCTSALDARVQRRTSGLQRSLHAATTELAEQAFRDPLTGLANRPLLDDRISHALARSRRDGADVALLMLNLDGFKPINDSFGHAAGDAVLREVATRLQAQARNHDTLARLGADEFVLLLEGETSEAVLAQAAQRLLDMLAGPMSIGEGSPPLRLSASVGIALHGGNREPDLTLIAQAESAAQAVKRGGGNGFAFFEAHMQDGVREQLELARDLRAVLDQAGAGQLSLHYQPKVTGDTEQVHGVEALLRWQHPQRGPVSPGTFIPVAERFGLIIPLGDWVIDEACRQLADWREQGLTLRVAINLSVQQLRQPEALLQHLQQALARHGLEVVAEGVETAGQAAELRARRCDKLQGFLFARPMPADDLTRWALRSQHRGQPTPLGFSDSVFASPAG